MALYDSHPDYTYGAIRNAHLAKMIFPGWKLIICVVDPSNLTLDDSRLVPDRVFRRLTLLGAEIRLVTSSSNHVISPELCSWLVADDPTVDIFMVRSVLHRLSAREWTAVDAWLSSNRIFHCLRDHESHARQAIVSNLWGARRTDLRTLLGRSMTSLLQQQQLEDSQATSKDSQSGKQVSLAERLLWPAVHNDVLCHDSVSHDRWPNSVPFIRLDEAEHYIGQSYDAYGCTSSDDLDTSLVLDFVYELWSCIIRYYILVTVIASVLILLPLLRLLNLLILKVY